MVQQMPVDQVQRDGCGVECLVAPMRAGREALTPPVLIRVGVTLGDEFEPLCFNLVQDLPP